MLSGSVSTRRVVQRGTTVQTRAGTAPNPTRISKRLLLLSGGVTGLGLQVDKALAGAAEKSVLPVNNLSVFQKREQREEFSTRVQSELTNWVKDSDAADLTRLVLAETSTYDAQTKTGGFDGSIFLDAGEANRPQNADLKPIMDRLREAKAAVDAHPDAQKTGPISYTDLMALACKVAIGKEWAAYRLKKSGRSADKAKILNQAYASNWSLPVGRVDIVPGSQLAVPTPPTKLPPRDASPSQVRDFFWALGNTDPSKQPGFFGGLPPFSEKFAFLLWTTQAADPELEGKRLAAGDDRFDKWRVNYERSKETTTRVNYELDLAEAYTRLTGLGASFNSNAYLYPVEGLRLKY